jgi:hypothetical protein
MKLFVYYEKLVNMFPFTKKNLHNTYFEFILTS